MPHPDLAGYLFGILPPQDTRAFDAHVADCAPCRAEVADLRGLPELLSAAAPVQPPPDLRERTFARIAAEPAGCSGGPAPTTTSAAETIARDNGRHRPHLLLPWPGWRGQPHPGPPEPHSGPPAHPPPGHPRSLRSSPRRLPALVAAAVVLLLAGMVSVNLYRQSQSGPPHSSTAGLPAAATVTLSLVAPPGGGPQHGTALIEQTPAGRVVHLNTSNLPPAPSGKRYVCWFVGPGDSLTKPNRVVLGSFITDAQGNAAITMTSAAPAQYFPLIGVTLEPDDGNPQRRGPKILRTEAPR
jgi:hypothetical protein